MIEFTTVTGRTAWVRPETVLCLFETVVTKDDCINRPVGEQVIGMIIVGGTTFWLDLAEGHRIVGEIAAATGEDWRLGMKPSGD